MWWLCVILLLLPTATQQGEARGTGLPVEMAMVGYDPIMADGMEQSDRGRKSQIFLPWQRDSIYVEKKEDMLNSFVEAGPQNRCSPFVAECIVRNYEEYKSLSSGVVSFATEDSATTPLGAAQFNFQENAGYGNLNNPNDVLLRDFFNQSQGEGRFIKAAIDTNSENRKKIFQKFVNSYGTHFARTTQFGYVAYFGKLFAVQTKSREEEAVRRRCMLESAEETLTSKGRGEFETFSQHVFRGAPGRCANEVLELMMPEIGSVSAIGLGDSGLAANESPKPVAYVLEKISALFEEDWFSSVTFQTRQIRLNATTLLEYFEEQLGEQSQFVVERAEAPSRNLFNWRRSITPNMTDITAAASGLVAEGRLVMSAWLAYGGIIIVGGRPSTTSNSFALFMRPPPLFPVKVHGNTLSVVGSASYSCGGGDGNKKCWHLETGANDATWEPFDIPWALQHHSAVVVQDDIWFFSNSKLMILHTRNSLKRFHEYNLEISFGLHICAVAHGSQIFVLGVGEKKNEVYVNNNSSKPEQWKRFTGLLQDRSYFGCLVYDTEIIVTGGWIEANSTSQSSVEAISVVDGSLRLLGPMRKARNSHKMAIVEGRPAVLGGHQEATIETYDGQTNSWNVMGYSLSEARHYFGLAQYRP